MGYGHIVHGCKFTFMMAICKLITNTVMVTQMELNGKQPHLVDMVS